MCRNGGDAEIDQRGRYQNGEDQVSRHCGHAHTKDQRGNHCQYQQCKQIAARKRNNGGRELQAQASDRKHANDDTGCGTNDCDSQNTHSAHLQAFNYFLERKTIFFVRECADYHSSRADQSRFCTGPLDNAYQNKHQDQRDEQKAALTQILYIGGIKLLGFLCAHDAQFVLATVEVNTHKDRNVVTNCRNDTGHHDFVVGYAQHFGHNECRSTHNRRHQLSAAGSRRLHCTGNMIFIAVALHHRNSNGASSRDIGGSRTGNAAKQRAGDNRNLGGSTYYLTEQQHGDVHEQLETAGDFQKTCKNYEDCDGAGCRPQRRTKNTLCTQADISNNAFESNARMSDR